MPYLESSITTPLIDDVTENTKTENSARTPAALTKTLLLVSLNLNLPEDGPIQEPLGKIIQSLLDNKIHLPHLLGHQLEIDDMNLDQLLITELPSDYFKALEDTNAVTITLSNFILAFAKAQKKTLRHDALQTSFKVFSGAFGWQLAFLLSLALLKYNYDAADLHLGKKIAIWLLTGLLAAIFLDLGIIMTQCYLSHYHNGIPPHRFTQLCLILLVSVTISDGLWQPFTDIGATCFAAISSPAIAYPVSSLVYLILYSLEAAIFQFVHNNLTGLQHGEEQIEFICDDSFDFALLLAYSGFNMMPTLFYSFVAESSTSNYVLNCLISCLVAGAGTTLLPSLFMLARGVIKYNHLQAVLTQFEQEASKHVKSNDPEFGCGREIQFLSESDSEETVTDGSTHNALHIQADINTSIYTTDSSKERVESGQSSVFFPRAHKVTLPHESKGCDDEAGKNPPINHTDQAKRA
jgi:hypothetical protein